jgi:hypothetical protein
MKPTKKEDGISIYNLKKILTDEECEVFANKKLSRIKYIIDHDADVYDESGGLLLKFRKNVLPPANVSKFYDNVINFAKLKTSNRGSASGSKTKNVADNPKIMSNIFGYFDRLSPKQKYVFTRKNKRAMLEVRECRFNLDFPTEYKNAIPLIEDIDRFYKKYTPTYYKNQFQKAKQTHFKIPNTVFTTVTTNVNYQTTVHKDKGDDKDGFGNLVVIENGEYSGGETCFPQYGIGVDVRTNDILLMNVHQWHANLPIILKTKDAVRLSIVCYLRTNIWEKTKNKSKKFFLKHITTMKKFRTTKTTKTTK